MISAVITQMGGLDDNNQRLSVCRMPIFPWINFQRLRLRAPSGDGDDVQS
ncbi:hypothetical protein OKW30_003562 [Paraburkholderia sp. Clong3]